MSTEPTGLQKGQSEGAKHFAFTRREEQRIQAIIEEGSYEKACVKLKIKLSTMRQSLYRVRARYQEAKDFTNKYEGLSRRLRAKTGKRYL